MKETIESNKLIAEFMDEEFILNSRKEWRCKHSNGRGLWLDERNLAYHHSWDWLMPVVEKIESIHKTDDTFSDCYVLFSKYRNNEEQFWYCNIFSSEDRQHNGESHISKIEAVWLAVIEFIKWYNNEK